MYKVNVRHWTSLQKKLAEQQPERSALGERSFEYYVDDNARNFAYIFLNWESLSSAHLFLDSSESIQLVKEWPVEEILLSIPLSNMLEIKGKINHG